MLAVSGHLAPSAAYSAIFSVIRAILPVEREALIRHRLSAGYYEQMIKMNYLHHANLLKSSIK
jgi:hypothetical protein